MATYLLLVSHQVRFMILISMQTTPCDTVAQFLLLALPAVIVARERLLTCTFLLIQDLR